MRRSAKQQKAQGHKRPPQTIVSGVTGQAPWTGIYPRGGRSQTTAERPTIQWSNAWPEGDNE